MFWIIVGIILVVVLGVARWVDHRARRRHTLGLRGSMRSHDGGLNDVMGKDYGAFTPRHATDPTQGPGGSGLF